MNKNIIRTAQKENLVFEEIQYKDGTSAAEFVFENYENFTFYRALFARKKNLHVETHNRSLCINVFDANEYAEHKANCKHAIFLNDLFYFCLRDGKSAAQAKKEQEKYCELHPKYKTAYDMIYN